MSSVYGTVGDNECRLLRPISSLGDRNLRFNIVHRSPSWAIPYTAVSYTWGQGEESRTIWIDGQPLMVRPNLWSCLNILRRSWDYIWVDAVCINQADVSERNQQVRIMEQIYRNAQVVSVWLGQLSLPDDIIVVGDIVDVETDHIDLMESVQYLANRPYWSRTWIIQEFLLARSVHLYCSNARVDVDVFAEAVDYKAGTSIFTMDWKDLAKEQDLKRQWRALPLLAARHIDRYPNVYQSLYNLLDAYQAAESTDPRDKVFALLSLVVPEERRLLLRHFPDYNMSINQVQVIALAHVTQFPGEGTPRGMQRILRALMIKGTDRAQRMLNCAHRIDYLGYISLMHIEEILSEPSTFARNIMPIPADYQTFEGFLQPEATCNYVSDFHGPGLVSGTTRSSLRAKALSCCFFCIMIPLAIWRIRINR